MPLDPNSKNGLRRQIVQLEKQFNELFLEKAEIEANFRVLEGNYEQLAISRDFHVDATGDAVVKLRETEAKNRKLQRIITELSSMLEQS